MECMLMSRIAVLLQYRPYFPSSVKDLAVFIDLAPKFQLMAEEVLQLQVQLVMTNLKQVPFWKQRYIYGLCGIFGACVFRRQIFSNLIMLKPLINQAIDGTNGFQNTHQMKQFESAKFCIDQVISIFLKRRRSNPFS